jgi:hypothetical protein
MNCRASGRVRCSITIRLSTEEKTWFASLARSRGVSESTLALSAVRALEQPDPCGPVPDATHSPATDRITIRLRPGDGDAIGGRASARGMKSSTYLAALVRAHLADNPPLAARELAELKLSIVLLAELGGFLVRTARNPSLGSAGIDDLRKSLGDRRPAVAALEQRTHDFVHKALVSWESRHA